MSPPDSYSRQSVPSAAARLTLHLGVVIQSYRSKSRKASALTTGDVAEILEAKYGLMATFYKVHQGDVAKAIENSLGGAMEALLMGQTVDPWGRGMQDIQREFKDFIASGESERVGIPGTPTKAALRGVSHRFKHPYAKHPRRPSFRDTGLYMASFKSWVE